MGKTRIKTVDESAQEEKPVIASEAKQSEKEIATEPVAPRDDEKKKSAKPGKAKPRSKKYQEVSKDLDRTKSYTLDEAVDMVKKLSYAKFEASLEAHISTAQTPLRGFLQLPYAARLPSGQAGKQEFKTEPKAPVIHMSLGKLNQPNEELVANITTLLSTLGKSKIKKIRLAPTMGPSVKIDLASI